MGLFDRLKAGLQKTREGISAKIEKVLVGFGRIDDELFEDLEEALVTADIGVHCTANIIEMLKEIVKERRLTDASEVRSALREIIEGMLCAAQYKVSEQSTADLKQSVLPKQLIIVVGVNGVGKTTTIGKLSARYQQEGEKVCMIAGDTFRAAAIDQLDIWAQRAGTEIYKPRPETDPAAAIYDGLQYAKKQGCTTVICDTAGRLHTKTNLMEELKKVHRIALRELDAARISVLLVLDASTGQNAVVQARTFQEMVEVESVALTKLDGTARGGVIIAIASELGLPIRYIGVGEALEDLQDFEAPSFVQALFEQSEQSSMTT